MTQKRRASARAIAHRRRGDEWQLPDEGRLGSLDGATSWINSSPFTSRDLEGRVVLVDFWTYTCINWLRTLPYLRAWEEAYSTSGLAIVGVHTPEFSFERRRENVVQQVRRLGITYPVAIDNDAVVWTEFANHYWPAVYIADAHGRVRYHHFGEGEYARTEMVIQQLLLEADAMDVGEDLATVSPTGLEVAADWSSLRSPETYLGGSRGSGGNLALNQWGVEGRWTIRPESLELGAADGSVRFRFQARDVNLVMGPGEAGAVIPFVVLLDGTPPGDSAGADVDRLGRGALAEQNVHQLIRQSGVIRERTVEIRFLAPGAQVFCFTFG